MPLFVECSTRALVLTPTGRDAKIVVALLADLGVTSDVCLEVADLAAEMERGAALAIIADEALRALDLRPITRFMSEQGAWSDLPIILLTHRGGVPGRDPELVRIANALGNVNFLERPFHTATLASMVRAAGRNRHRQYEARTRHEEIIEREEQLQTAMTAGRLGSWRLKSEDLKLEMSRTSCGHFGRPPGSSPTFADIAGVVHVAERERWILGLRHALERGEDYIAELRNLWPDGTEHWVDLRARPLRDPLGGVTGLVGVSADITGRKIAELERERLVQELAAQRTALSNLTRTLEERVDQRTAQLRDETAAKERTQLQLLQAQKMESIGQLTGGIAHDFNNLLMAIMGSLEVLKKRVPSEPNVARLIEAAMQGTTRGASLTQRMLAFARQQELRATSTDLGGLVLGMQELLQRSIGPQIAMQMHARRGLNPALVDPHQVELAILNLVINARDAMPRGGSLSIRLDDRVVHPGEDTSARLGCKLKPGKFLRIQVIDTGTGMDAETLTRAVEPFFSTKPAGRGTGLGLSMTHGLAMQLGGALALESTLGEGTTASLWLPAASTPAEVDGRMEQSPATTSPKRILLVDDDPLVAMSTIDMLVDLGHTVTEANSAEGALEILDRGAPLDLIVTDHAMPGMTGTELAAIVRERRPELKVLLVTGYSDVPVAQQKLPRLSKPYFQSQLQAAIADLLDAPV